MIVDKIKDLNIIKNRFQSYITNPNLTYSYIAPKNKILYDRFFSFAANMPTQTSSMFEVLSNENTVSKLLLDNFSDDTELDIYIASDDTLTSIFANGTLNNYILKNNIPFTY